MDVSNDELPGLYSWVDSIPLSRPKRNIARDFSDGVLAAEVVANYCPKLVEIHNYSAANSLAQKIYNWNTLNIKVFRRLNFSLSKEDIEGVANAEHMAIERVLKLMKYKIAKHKPNACRSYKENAKEEMNSSLGSAQGLVSSRSQTKSESSPLQFQSASYLRSSPPRHPSPSKHIISQERQQVCRGGESPLPCSQDTGLEGMQDKDMQKELQKDAQIKELMETVELLEAKVMKLEQLVRLKDHKIQVLSGRGLMKTTNA
ncbi:hypothetical protein KP509_39G031300 [Ceratopteris richardii]|uniref:Calponin-homology (CH) domain-containing protein n=1 Tax=Ceratopteris richardii TaxID=49495 RepID=A0A8T2Q046_CERRI|nr:hypothetical protein KP509_39G031300 [Ceratopteris richardii]